jgi:signal transduction histidine kinase
MDEITRAVELTKARMLELDAAIIEIAVETAEASRDYEALAKRVCEIAATMKDQCREIRAAVAQYEPGRN